MDAAILEDTQPEPALSAAAETEGVALEAYKVASEKIASTVSQEVQKVEGALAALGAAQQQRADALAAEQARAARQHKLEREEIAAQSAAALCDVQLERDRLDREKKAMAAVHEFQSSLIKLNVGGVFCSTSRLTLLAVPGSMLAVMFSGRHPLIAEQDGSYFIDRDGRHFHHILNFLRNGAISVELDTDLARELAVEAEYYGEGPP